MKLTGVAENENIPNFICRGSSIDRGLDLGRKRI